jgi:hypothetical protein
MENSLRAKPMDIREQYERQLKELQEAYGEAMLERLSFPGDNALLGFTLEVQLHRAIHTVNLLMVPGLAICS